MGTLKNTFNEPSPEEISEFLDAAGDGEKATVAEFLKKYKSIIEQREPEDGWTALMMAAMRNYKSTVKLLLDKGADLEARDNKGRTVLMLMGMCDKGAEMTQFLLERGADINAKSDCGSTAPMYAASFAGPEIIAVMKEWPEKEKQRREKEREKEHAQWLEDTDCSKGLEKPIAAPRPLKIPGKGR